MLRFLFLLLLVFLWFFSFSQSDELRAKKDSLSGQDIPVLARLYWEIYNITGEEEDYSSAINFYKRFPGNGKYECFTTCSRANHFLANSQYDSTKLYLDRVRQRPEFKNNESVKRKYYRTFGLMYAYRAEFEESIESYHQQLSLAKETGDSVVHLFAISDLAIPHYFSGAYEEAISLWKEAISIGRRTKHHQSIYENSLNVALAYSQLEQLDSSSRYFQYCQELIDKEEIEIDYVSFYLNLGVLEYHKENYEEAIDQFIEAGERSILLGDEVSYARVLSNISSSYNKLGRAEEGVAYVKEALEIAKKNQRPNFIYTIYDNLSEAYESLGDYQKAFHYLDSSETIKDSIMSIKRMEQLTEMEKKYQSAEKDKLIAQERVEKEKEKFSKTIFLVALILVSCLAFFILRIYQQKRKSAFQLQHQNEIIEQKNRDITDSIQYAKNLQESILPKQSVIVQSFPNYMLYFRPRDIVSGDFYWYNENETHSYIAAADCTGHGVPGAFVSVMCYNLLNKAFTEKGLVEPGAILTEVNQLLLTEFKNQFAHHQSNDGMDITLVALNKKTQQISFAGAMNDLIQIRQDNIMEHKADRRSIGGGTAFDYQFNTIQVETQQKDTFYLYSDGYQDQFGGTNEKKFMAKRFKSLLHTITGKNAKDQESKLQEVFDKWRGENEQIDDILIVGFEVV